MLAEGTVGTNRVETKLLIQLGESSQVIQAGKIPATAAGTIPAAVLQVATKPGEAGLNMDPKVKPTITKAGAHKARIAIVHREEMRITAKTGTSRAHVGIVLNGGMRILAKPGIHKAQLTIVLMGETLGEALQDPGHRLIIPDLQAMLVDGVMMAGQRAMATTTVFQATCQALGTTMQALNLESTADLTSLPKAGTIPVMETPPLPAKTAVTGGAGLLHKDLQYQARVVIKAGEEEATKAEVRRATGTQEVGAQEEDGMITHPTMLDRLPTHGRRTSLVIPKVRPRIGSGSTGVGLGILLVTGIVIGDD